MADYKETTVAGSEYTRARQVRIENPRPGTGTPSITFLEERVTTLSDRTIASDVSQITEMFTPETAATAFPLINPVDGTPLGQDATYQQLYVLLWSAYFYLAGKRDAAQAEQPA